MICNPHIVYYEGARTLRWDIYRPDGRSDGRPAVLVIHGGGWREGSRKAMADACAAFCAHGVIAIAPEYRLLGEANWPAPLRDVEQAVAMAALQSEKLACQNCVPEHRRALGDGA